jgi:hypothetical protein
VSEKHNIDLKMSCFRGLRRSLIINQGNDRLTPFQKEFIEIMDNDDLFIIKYEGRIWNNDE